MSRLAILGVCLAILNGISGCACCSCCAPVSGCCSAAPYAMNDGDYPIDFADDGGYYAPSNCNCGGEGAMSTEAYAPLYGEMNQTMPITAQRSRINPGRTYRSGNLPAAPQYASYNSSQYVTQPMRQARRVSSASPLQGNIRQTGMSTWEPAPGTYGNIVPQSYQRPAPCNCGK